MQKLFNDVAPKFADRQGGYTRIIKLADYRIGDGGSLVLLQLLTEESQPDRRRPPQPGLRRKRNERRHQFAGQGPQGPRRRRPAASEGATASEAGDGEAAPQSE